MANVFTDYPEVPWKQGWRLAAGPSDPTPFFTGDTAGEIRPGHTSWSLVLSQPSPRLNTRLFSNALAIRSRKHGHSTSMAAILIEPGILTGTVSEMPLPELKSDREIQREENLAWIKTGRGIVLLLSRDSRFALVAGEYTHELALAKAEEALEPAFSELEQKETQQRKRTSRLFSINPRHNPPVAVAAESLRQRLRSRTAALHGTWSISDGFGHETFSLNELYPLTEAWLLTDPEVPMQLVTTALSLQQRSGGFPAWADSRGMVSSAVAWPMIIQSFELAWQQQSDATLLKTHLPALRKYMQWALRYFDPHRDLIPAWQGEAEIFVPDSYDRGKATPELTVMLIGELEALQRLCGQLEHTETATPPLQAEQEQLASTLTTVFWNAETKEFSNVWKDGHTLHEPSFASFLPLFWRGLPAGFKAPLLENFEETRGFPGHGNPVHWNKEQIDGSTALPAVHQFMAFQALRRADSGRALLMLFVRRARDGFSAWFERESIQAARHITHGGGDSQTAFELGPVTASLLLTTQAEFQQDTSTHAPVAKTIQQWFHQMRLTTADLKIVLIIAIGIAIIHLLYNLPGSQTADSRMAEAALSYSQGQFRRSLQICRQHPDHPLAQFLEANLLMLTESPAEAEALYLKALRSETASPSALFGYALALQMNGKFDEAAKRYNDFIDIYEYSMGGPIIEMAYGFLRLTEEKFATPPKWKRVYALPMMNDLGL